jgi:hypothetical protein
MRLALALLASLACAQGAAAQTVQDRYGPPRPVARPPAAAVAAPGVQQVATLSPYAGRMLNWTGKATTPVPEAPAEPAPPVAVQQPVAAPPPVAVAPPPRLLPRPAAAHTPAVAAAPPPVAAPPAPAPTVAVAPPPRAPVEAPAPRQEARQAPVAAPPPVRAPAPASPVPPAPRPEARAQAAPLPDSLYAAPPPAAPAPKPQQLAAAAPAPATPVSTGSHSRLYSVHRDYGLAPDAIPAPRSGANPYVLISVPEPAAGGSAARDDEDRPF